MEPDELLEEIRYRMKALSALDGRIDASAKASQDLVTRIAERKTNLAGAVDVFRAHLQAKVDEVAVAFTALDEAVREGLEVLALHMGERQTAADQLIDELQSEGGEYEAVEAAIQEDRTEEVNEAGLKGQDTVKSAQEAADAAQSIWDAEVRNKLQPAMDKLNSDLAQAESAGRNKLSAAAEGTFEEARKRYLQDLPAATTVTLNRTALQTGDMCAGVERCLSEALMGQLGSVERLMEDVRRMQEDLESFGRLTRTTAAGMVRASDDARVLMNSTSSGLATVVGILEKVTQILDELRSELP